MIQDNTSICLFHRQDADGHLYVFMNICRKDKKTQELQLLIKIIYPHIVSHTWLMRHKNNS